MGTNALAYEAPVNVQRTFEVTRTPISYSTQIIQDPNTYEGISSIVQVGILGETTHTKIGRTLNGKYFQTSLDDVITAQPIGEIINLGVKPYPTMLSNDKRFIFPCTGVVTSTDKSGSHANFEAVDVANSLGTPLYSPADGVITQAGENGGYGNSIQLSSGEYSFLLGHLSVINVNVGQAVTKGELIGEMGSTGNSTGSHLHFESYKNGVKQYIPNIFNMGMGESV